MNNQNKNNMEHSQTDFHQAAVVNDRGEEIAITEEMVQKACQEMDSAALAGSNKQKTN